MSTLVKRNSYLPSLSFFDDFLTRDLFDQTQPRYECSIVPRVNIIETNDDFKVEMAVPGMKKEDFHLELDNDTLTVYTDREEDVNQEGHQFTRREFNYSSFKRSFHLPNTVEAGKTEARYKDGILSLVVPKKEEARKKPVKSISIS